MRKSRRIWRSSAFKTVEIYEEFNLPLPDFQIINRLFANENGENSECTRQERRLIWERMVAKFPTCQCKGSFLRIKKTEPHKEQENSHEVISHNAVYWYLTKIIKTGYIPIIGRRNVQSN
jgi:hypothetical protein